MKLSAISDLHVRSEQDPVYAALLRWLRDGGHAAGDVVVLAGDIFDLFIGRNRLFLERYREFLSILHELGSRGVRLHYIEGNHDFLLKAAYGHVPGMQVHRDEFQVRAAGRQFWIAHGDLADRRDYGYRLTRRFFRSPVSKGLASSLPDEWVDRIGRGLSGGSRAARPWLMDDLPEERRVRLRTMYRAYAAGHLMAGADFAILGHCHDLDGIEFHVGGRDVQYLNVGFPPVHRTSIRWESGWSRMQRVPFEI